MGHQLRGTLMYVYLAYTYFSCSLRTYITNYENDVRTEPSSKMVKVKNYEPINIARTLC
jgi:hypothetical protein